MENKIDSKTLAIEIAKVLDKKKAQDVRVLKVESLTVLTDYFVIASGTSTTQVGALADEVEYELSQKHGIPYSAFHLLHQAQPCVQNPASSSFCACGPSHAPEFL